MFYTLFWNNGVKEYVQLAKAVHEELSKEELFRITEGESDTDNFAFYTKGKNENIVWNEISKMWEHLFWDEDYEVWRRMPALAIINEYLYRMAEDDPFLKVGVREYEKEYREWSEYLDDNFDREWDSVFGEV